MTLLASAAARGAPRVRRDAASERDAMRRAAALLALALALLAGRAALRRGRRARRRRRGPSSSQRLGAALPLDAPFIDASGRPVRARRLLRRRPPGRPRPRLLPLPEPVRPRDARRAARRSHASGLPRRDYRIVAVSIDPDETPADARAPRARLRRLRGFLRRGARAARAARPAPARRRRRRRSRRSRAGRLRLSARCRATQATPAPSAAASRYAHAAGFVVVTPDGRISRYLLGVRFDAARRCAWRWSTRRPATIGSAQRPPRCCSAPTSTRAPAATTRRDDVLRAVGVAARARRSAAGSGASARGARARRDGTRMRGRATLDAGFSLLAPAASAIAGRIDAAVRRHARCCAARVALGVCIADRRVLVRYRRGARADRSARRRAAARRASRSPGR